MYAAAPLMEFNKNPKQCSCTEIRQRVRNCGSKVVQENCNSSVATNSAELSPKAAHILK